MQIIGVAELEAERSTSCGPIRKSDFVPLVKSQCICRNNAKPDKDGNTYHNPSCLVPGHGCMNRYIEQSHLDSKFRTVGVPTLAK